MNTFCVKKLSSILAGVIIKQKYINSFNAEATFVQSTRTQSLLKTI